MKIFALPFSILYSFTIIPIILFVSKAFLLNILHLSSTVISSPYLFFGMNAQCVYQDILFLSEKGE